jgi:lysozyme
MTRPAPACAIDFIKAAEALVLTAYQDAGGSWTVGYGHTGEGVSPGLTIDEPQALAWLSEDIATAAARLAAKAQAEVIEELTDNEYAAMLSFVFNLGTPGTGIWRALNGRRFDEVPVQMMRFVYAGGVKVPGLAKRRAAEVALWSTPEPGAAAAAPPPSSYTRAAPTPPLPTDAKPAMQSKSLMTSAASGVAAATVAVTQVSQAVSPYADRNPLVGRAVAGLALAAAVLAALAVVFVWLKKREALT